MYNALVKLSPSVFTPGIDHKVIKSENLLFLNTEIAENSLGLKNSVDVCYIDPPYNTGATNFTYSDTQKTSDWLNFMELRLQPLQSLLKETGIVLVSIDDSEVHTLRVLMDKIFGKKNFIAQLVVDGGNPKNNARFFSISHEYIIVYAKNRQMLLKSGARWRTRRDGIDILLKEYSKQVKIHGDDYAAITSNLKKWVKQAPLSKRLKVFYNADANGLYTYADLSAPGFGSRYDVLHPETGKPCQVPSRGWRIKQEKMQTLLNDNMILFGRDETLQPMKKLYLKDEKDQVKNAILSYPSRTTTHILEKLLGQRMSFTHPKNLNLMKDLLDLVTPENGIVLDYFAGSGTTGHAILELNQENTESNRTFILVTNNENSIYDKITRPRIEKVWNTLSSKKLNPLSDSVTFGEYNTVYLPDKSI